MIRRLRPTTAVPVNAGFSKPADQRWRHPDVIETSAAIRRRPVAGSIAPPSIQALRWWNEVANGVDKITGALQSIEPLDLDRSVADDGQKLFVRPDVGFERGDVEVAHRDHRTAVLPLCRKPRCELGEKLQFM